MPRESAAASSSRGIRPLRRSPAFAQAAAGVGLGPLVERVAEGYSERSPNGFHLFYRCEELSGNTKLASGPKRLEEIDNEHDTVKVLIETRGEGGFAIIAPTNGAVHPSGGSYDLVSGGPATIVTITADERQALHDLARTFDEMPQREVVEPRAALGVAGDRPGDEYNARVTWPEILVPAGWTEVYTQDGKTFWRRPGKRDHWSATTNHEGSNYLYVFSSSTEFEAHRGYSPFSAYSLLEHGGDFEAAARELGVVPT